MICENCRTTLPDDAIACWKCGARLAPPARQAGPDVLLAILTFVIAGALFACVGWSVPFTVWGLINSAAKDSPQWSGVLGIVSGMAFVLAALAFFGGVWWGSYWLIARLTAKPGER
jgi:ribosomal protein L40E